MGTFRNDRTENRKITISDVAEELQVSKTTVSRAISGKGRIGEETRRRVLDYIAAKDYKPNVIAKGLAQQKTYNIALAIPGDCNLVDMPFLQNGMQGICEEASAHDYDVMLVTITGDDLGNLERMIANHKVDGVILSRSMVHDAAAGFLKAQEIPFVLMGTSRDRDILQVDNDHRAGCRELVETLLQGGNTRIGLVGGSKSYVVNHTRLQGYEDALRAARTDDGGRLVFEDCDTPAKVELAVDGLLEAQAECIVCMDDAICLTVLQTLSARQVRVPEQMQVASFYDSTLLLNNTPAVTSLLFDDKTLGAHTCSVLLHYIQGDEVKGRTLLGYEVRLRASTRRDGGEDAKEETIGGHSPRGFEPWN
ncbi:MAG: LacI family transcriptional regulator [Roseburia sp.]|nr:LacI family transcriptional regulator [Roseburia sp.]